METRSLSERPLIVIVGPTASGKTGVAIEIAKKCNGEIICADSRTVYRGMNIGTAKPTLEERQGIPHWGLDLIDPDEKLTAYDFKKYAEVKINEIRARHRTPILVGGTGLYIDAVIFDYQFGSKSNDTIRSQFEKMSIEELQNYCIKNNIILPENYKNKRHLIRAAEQKTINKKRRKMPIEDCIIVGIATDRHTLKERIKDRAEQLFQNGVVDEATGLGKKYGWNIESMTGNIYPLVRSYLAGELSLKDMKEKFITLDWRLAKRQLTWLKRNPYIRWLSLSEADGYVLKILADEEAP